LLVKPIGTKDLLRQIEALLVLHRDVQQEDEKLLSPPTPALSRDTAGWNRDGTKKAS
jgi:hypothetical protein